jgi:RNA polymerase sigma factor (sigma-70 family)
MGGYEMRACRGTARVSSDTAYQSDPKLVQACLAGDEAAWAKLVEKYQRLVLSVARKCGLSDADADDVFQTVFTILYRRLEGLTDQTRLSAWLITTTYRESWRFRKGGEGQTLLDETVEDSGTPPEELVAQTERERLVREAMARLDDRCRDLLTALFLSAEAPSYDQIATRFGMPIGSIGPTRARCFKKLESILIGLGIDR